MIKFNGEDLQWRADLSMHALLEEHGFAPALCMVQLNDTVMTPDTFSTVVIADNDNVEAIRFMSGG